MASGIYTITNKVNGKIYVGFTNNFISRKQTHFANLRHNSHDNNYLQNAWNKYGEEAFEFEILEECSEEYLASQEHYWATILNVNDREYGYNRMYTHPYGRTNHSEETKEKISESKRGKKKKPNSYTWKHKPESIEKMRNAKLGKKTVPCSEERKRKISESNKGKKRPKTQEHIEKIALCLRGRKRPNFSDEWKSRLSISATGRKHTDETKRKISDRSSQDDNKARLKEMQKKSSLLKIGTHLSKDQKIKANTTRYGSRIIEIYNFSSKEFVYSCNIVNEAVEFTGLKRSNINNNLCGLSKRAGNYIFKYKEV